VTKLKLFVVICLALALVLIPLVGACTTAVEPPPGDNGETPPPEEVYHITFATGMPASWPDSVALTELAEKLPGETNGRVEMDFYPAGQLYTHYETGPLIEAGDLEMGLGGFCLGAISPGWNAICGLPFLFDDYEHYLRFTQTDAFQTLNDDLEAKGIKYLLDFFDPGASYFFNSVRPLENLEDFQGLKLRVAEIPALLKVCETFGAQSVTIAGEEVPTAFETGMIDGCIAAGMNISMYDLAHNCPYVTMYPISLIPVTVVVNTEWWNNLPSDIQQIIMRLLEEAVAESSEGYLTMGAGMWAQYEAEPGVVVTYLTQAEKDSWREAAMSSWETSAAESEEVRMIIEAANSVR
jgi:TRAP-type C4-dicarboxylate transport system substrate-binding protein